MKTLHFIAMLVSVILSGMPSCRRNVTIVRITIPPAYKGLLVVGEDPAARNMFSHLGETYMLNIPDKSNQIWTQSLTPITSPHKPVFETTQGASLPYFHPKSGLGDDDIAVRFVGTFSDPPMCVYFVGTQAAAQASMKAIAPLLGRRMTPAETRKEIEAFLNAN